MSAYKFPFVGRPFKGLWYYEWQVGPVVHQVKHDHTHISSGRGLHLGQYQAWWDSAWWHETTRKLRRLWRRARRLLRR